MADIRWTTSPWGFRQTPLDVQCRWLKKMGIGYICGQCFAEATGLFDPEISDTEIARARELVEGYGLRYASFNGDGDFMVEKHVDKEIAACCRRIDVAAQFRPEVIIVFAGWQARDDGAVYDQVSAALRQVAEHAATYKLTVALENHGGLTRTPEQINRLLDKVRLDNIGVNYDPANFRMYGQDPLEALDALRHRIVFTHLKSLRTVGGKRSYCRVSEGEIDYLPILKRLQQSYTGFYGLEYEDTSDVIAGSEDDFKTLNELLART